MKVKALVILSVSFLLLLASDCSLVLAAEEGSGYLANYQAGATTSNSPSSWSMVSYIISLLIVFGFVVFLAYFASRFIGSKFSNIRAGKAGKLLASMSLGTNHSLCVVEIAGKVMLLGVTEQQITLLGEVTDELEIAKLRNVEMNDDQNITFQQAFEKQLLSLNSLSKKIPTMVQDKINRK